MPETGNKPGWKLSRSAAKRVRNPLPIPKCCPYCHSSVAVAENKVIYGKPVGEWPYVYLCQNADCKSYVGIHPETDIPLGTLANAQTRTARIRARDLFNSYLLGTCKMTRTEAYSWLAGRLGIAVAGCHFAWFDLATCTRVSVLIDDERKRTQRNDARQLYPVGAV